MKKVCSWKRYLSIVRSHLVLSLLIAFGALAYSGMFALEVNPQNGSAVMRHAPPLGGAFIVMSVVLFNTFYYLRKLRCAIQLVESRVRCRSCGYQLVISNSCPECGASIPEENANGRTHKRG